MTNPDDQEREALEETAYQKYCDEDLASRPLVPSNVFWHREGFVGGYRAALAAREEPYAKTHEYALPPTDAQVEIVVRGLEGICNYNGFAFDSDDLAVKARGMLTAVFRASGPTPREAIRAYHGAVANRQEAEAVAREDTERPDEIERLREGLERALDVSFIVGLLRVRAGKTDDAELAEWGERLKGQLVAIREVLSPGTAAAMAELRDTERPDDRPAREKFERK
jgi:hypothetical protein